MPKTYTLPELGSDFVLLAPMDMLTLDDTWINRSDMIGSCDSVAAVLDEQQRATISRYLTERLSTKSKPKPKEVKEVVAKVFAAFPWMADLSIKLKEDAREEATASSAAKTADARAVLINQVQAAAADIAGKADLWAKPFTSLDERARQSRRSSTTRAAGRPHRDHPRRRAAVRFGKGGAGVLRSAARVLKVRLQPRAEQRPPVDFKISAGAHDSPLSSSRSPSPGR